MKITILLDSLGKGGKERRLLALIKGLLHSHDVHLELIVFKDKIHYREVYDLGIPVHIIERKPRYDPLTFLKLYRLCRRFKPDIIHTWATMCSYLAYPSQKLLGCKVVNSNIAKAPNHLRFWHREFLWEKGAMLLSDAIVSNSQAGLRAYKAPRSRSRVIANGFDLLRTRDVLRGDKMKRKLNIVSRIVETRNRHTVVIGVNDQLLSIIAIPRGTANRH